MLVPELPCPIRSTGPLLSKRIGDDGDPCAGRVPADAPTSSRLTVPSSNTAHPREDFLVEDRLAVLRHRWIERGIEFLLGGMNPGQSDGEGRDPVSPFGVEPIAKDARHEKAGQSRDERRGDPAA